MHKNIKKTNMVMCICFFKVDLLRVREKFITFTCFLLLRVNDPVPMHEHTALGLSRTSWSMYGVTKPVPNLEPKKCTTMA